MASNDFHVPTTISDNQFLGFIVLLSEVDAASAVALCFQGGTARVSEVPIVNPLVVLEARRRSLEGPLETCTTPVSSLHRGPL